MFFISDTHFWHPKLAKLRGFESSEAMNDRLIENWNSYVDNYADVFILGDFSMAGSGRTLDVLSQLCGRKILIRGNHDKGMNKVTLDKFAEVYEYLKIKPEIDGEKQHIVLSHFPFLVWDMCHYGSWHLHGHSHGSCRYPNPNAKILDVGVDARFEDPKLARPLHLSEIAVLMKSRTIVSNDHHTPRETNSSTSTLIE